MHGGGGYYSHVSCTLDGIAFESRGHPGVLWGHSARHWNDPLYHDFWYLPGPITGEGAFMALSDAQQDEMYRLVTVELGHRFESRVEDSDYRDTLVGYVLNNDAKLSAVEEWQSSVDARLKDILMLLGGPKGEEETGDKAEDE